jgi:hypothetical protein
MLRWSALRTSNDPVRSNVVVVAADEDRARAAALPRGTGRRVATAAKPSDDFAADDAEEDLSRIIAAAMDVAPEENMDARHDKDVAFGERQQDGTGLSKFSKDWQRAVGSSEAAKIFGVGRGKWRLCFSPTVS